eukprot:GILK01003078.1.p1 GENE.GILK01003078.1~~GILK01003078.1.p1  ORF type:complete len:389 (+),score=53.50 GILK01003078.1:128-1168(+)
MAVYGGLLSGYTTYNKLFVLDSSGYANKATYGKGLPSAEFVSFENAVRLFVKFSGVGQTVDSVRRAIDDVVLPVQSHVEVTAFNISYPGGVFPVEWVYTNASSDKVLVYFHGGGYMAGSANSHRRFLGYLADQLHVKGLNVDYRLLPEFPMPIGVEDCFAAYRYLIEELNLSPNNIVLAGDSAGGALVLHTLILARDRGVPLPSGGVMLSPFTDLSLNYSSFNDNAPTDFVLSPDQLAWTAETILNSANNSDPRFSPYFADLSGLPPVLIQVAQLEVLRDDGVNLSKKIKAAGGDVVLQVEKFSSHMLPMMFDFVPEAAQAVSKIVDYLQLHFGIVESTSKCPLGY